MGVSASTLLRLPHQSGSPFSPTMKTRWILPPLLAVAINSFILAPRLRAQVYEKVADYSEPKQVVLNVGAAPAAPLVEGSDGNFYGSTSSGGLSGYGTLFKMTPGGQLTTLLQFAGNGRGAEPKAPLVQGSDGNFYGTTEGVGAF